MSAAAARLIASIRRRRKPRGRRPRFTRRGRRGRSTDSSSTKMTASVTRRTSPVPMVMRHSEDLSYGPALTRRAAGTSWLTLPRGDFVNQALLGALAAFGEKSGDGCRVGKFAQRRGGAERGVPERVPGGWRSHPHVRVRLLDEAVTRRDAEVHVVHADRHVEVLRPQHRRLVDGKGD